ncbi:hypothetical protein NMG60_11020728 [Bertholletia excelsa]
MIVEDEEDNLLQGINSFRQSLNLPALSKNDKAGCLAGEIADLLEGQPCSTTGPITSATANSRPQIVNYPNLLDKCDIDVNSTQDGVILPVCVPKLVPTLVLTNYTRSDYAKYLNNSKYTGAGLGSEEDWMVVVLTTSTLTGNFVGAASWVDGVGLVSQSLVVLLLEVVFVVLN